MNRLIIDIRDTCLRAVLSNDGVLEYCRSFDFEPVPSGDMPDSSSPQQPARMHAAAADNPYLIYYDETYEKNPWELALKQIIRQIHADIKCSVDSTHLIVPSDDVTMASHQLPKMAPSDSQKLIGRKISAEAKEDFPPFTIIPAISDQKTQTWCSLYIPTNTLRNYHKAFSACRVRLTSVTTPVNAMIDAFRSVRDAIFNAHAIFEVQRGFVEAFYISSDGILHFQRLPYASSSLGGEANEEEAEKVQKLNIFKIINTIFSINSSYQSSYPNTPVQMAWLCGLEYGLDDIATTLKETMNIEVGIAPAMPTGLPDESCYVPLAGFAASLQSNQATTYAAADFLKRFPLRKTSGIIIYAVTACAALLAVTLTEHEYRNLQKELKQSRQPLDEKTGKGKMPAAAAGAGNLEDLKKLTAKQFVFYNLFRELAGNLPDGVYLENLEFSIKDEKGYLNISAVARLDDKIAETMLLTRFIAMLDNSETLKKHNEPSITVVDRDKERFYKISVVSEVPLFDSKK